MAKNNIVSLKVNTFYNIIKTISTVIFPLIVFPYISRILGPENIGKINFSVIYVDYFSLLASLGINTYAVRECAKRKGDYFNLSNLASQIYSINVIMMAISYAFMALTIAFFKVIHPYVRLVIIQSISIFFTTIGTDWINLAMEDLRFITVRTFVFRLLSLLLILLFVREIEDCLKYAAITIVCTGCENIANCFYRKKYCKIKFTARPCIKMHISPIFILFTMILAQRIFCNIDITMLGIITDDYTVGIYSTAVKVFNIVFMVPIVIADVLMPRLTYYFEHQMNRELNSILDKALEYMISIGMPSALGVIIWGKEILMIVGGTKYLAALPYLQVLMIAMVVSLIGGSYSGNLVLIPSGREKDVMAASCLAAVCNFVLNLLFIPKYGAFAASITTLIAHCAILLYLYPKCKRIVGNRNRKKIFLPPAAGTAVLIIVCIFFKIIINNVWISFFISIIIGGLSYLATLLILKYEIAVDLLVLLKLQILQKIIRPDRRIFDGKD